VIHLCALGSGSSGNCFYIGTETGGLLMDAGFSAKETFSRLNAVGIELSKIKGVVISHEHNDHVKGLGPVARKLNIPVHVNHKTLSAICGSAGVLPAIRIFNSGESFEAGGLEVTPFSIPHDAADPCAFVFRVNGTSVAVATDAGSATTLIKERLRGVNHIAIESNHDIAMLQAGPYPWELKQRIASRFGHLSNETCGDILKELIHPGLQGVTLAHISKVNNNVNLVRLTADDALNGSGVSYHIASQDAPGPLVVVE
jgi:phosphoribosyl 1,2-cyclic phosphodiesterase